MKLRTIALIAAMTCTELQGVRDLQGHRTNQAKLNKPAVRSSTPLDLGTGPEYSSDIAGDGPRKMTFDEDDYNPELERVKKRRLYNSRRTKANIKATNENRSKATIQAQNKKRSKADIQA